MYNNNYNKLDSFYKMGNNQNRIHPAQEFAFKPFILTSISYKFEYKNKGGNKCLWPKPRSGHRIVCDDENVYCFGGYNPLLSVADEKDLASDMVWSNSKPLFRELWKYNMCTRMWKKLDVGHIPDYLISNGVLLSGSVLMVYGGTGVPFGENCSKDLYICDLSLTDNLSFQPFIAAGNNPRPQYGQGILLIDHYLYTLGGTTGFEFSCDIHRLNLKDGMWETLYRYKWSDDEPEERYRHELACYEGRIYVLGGGTSDKVFGFKTVFAFSLTTGLWKKITTKPDNKSKELFPSGRRCHSCVQRDQYVYIIGGYTGHSILTDTWRLDLGSFQWENIPTLSLTPGVCFHSSCLTPSGKLVTFGGVVQWGDNSKRSSDVHTAWLCIPKLKEICWEAILFYNQNFQSLAEEDVRALGIPDKFIQRLNLYN